MATSQVPLRNQETPLTFELPDGDKVNVITWPYVMKKCEELLTPIANNISISNTQLERIDARLSEWLENAE